MWGQIKTMTNLLPEICGCSEKMDFPPKVKRHEIITELFTDEIGCCVYCLATTRSVFLD